MELKTGKFFVMLLFIIAIIFWILAVVECDRALLVIPPQAFIYFINGAMSGLASIIIAIFTANKKDDGESIYTNH